MTLIPVAAVLAAMVCLCAAAQGAATRQPNIILLLTDDQDLMLGGLDHMPALREYVTSAGASLDKHMVNTPICCPSRATLLSSRYYHNNRVYDPALGGCMHMNTSEASNPQWERDTFAPRLKDAGYTTSYVGKYLNEMPEICQQGKVAPGWDHWMPMCQIDYYNVSWLNGTTPFKTCSAPEEYSTSLIGNYTMAWIRHVTADKDHPPFFAAMGPHAPHLPSTPAAWYKQKWPQGLEVTKLPSYNVSAPDHHWIVSMQPILNEDDAKGIREEYTNRHRTLLSVDDIVREVAEYLKEIGEWDNTYFFYTSDHGYSLGEFRIPSHKTQVYDHNTRVPMLVKGPGIKAGSSLSIPSAMVDLGLTFIELAKGQVPAAADGKSFAAHLVTEGEAAERFQAQRAADGSFRDHVLIEYESIRAVPTYSDYGAARHPHDNSNNTYRAIRVDNATDNFLYAEFTDFLLDWNMTDLDFYEYYDCNADPYQMKNIYHTLEDSRKAQLHARLLDLWHCSGPSCNTL